MTEVPDNAIPQDQPALTEYRVQEHIQRFDMVVYYVIAYLPAHGAVRVEYFKALLEQISLPF